LKSGFAAPVAEKNSTESYSCPAFFVPGSTGGIYRIVGKKIDESDLSVVDE